MFTNIFTVGCLEILGTEKNLRNTDLEQWFSTQDTHTSSGTRWNCRRDLGKRSGFQLLVNMGMFGLLFLSSSPSTLFWTTSKYSAHHSHIVKSCIYRNGMMPLAVEIKEAFFFQQIYIIKYIALTCDVESTFSCIYQPTFPCWLVANWKR